MKQAIDTFTIDMFEVRDSLTTDPENNPVHEAVLFYWGGRCSEHDPECSACNAWKLYDNMIGGLK